MVSLLRGTPGVWHVVAVRLPLGAVCLEVPVHFSFYSEQFLEPTGHPHLHSRPYPPFPQASCCPRARQVSPTCHTPIPALPLLLCRCPGGLTSALGWAGRTCSGRVGTHPPGGAQRVPPSLTGAKEPAERNTTSAASTAWPKKAGRQRMILHPAPTPATSLPRHGSCCPGFRDLTRHTHPLMPDD